MTWFKYDGVNMQWLNSSPNNSESECDRCGRTVGRSARRLRVDDNKGPQRKRGKSRRHTYLCESCGKRRLG